MKSESSVSLRQHGGMKRMIYCKPAPFVKNLFALSLFHYTHDSGQSLQLGVECACGGQVQTRLMSKQSWKKVARLPV